MVYELKLTYDEIVDFSDVKYIAGSNVGYTLAPSLYDITDICLMLKSLLRNKIKVKITTDDI